MKVNEKYNYQGKDANGVTVNGVRDLIPEVYYDVLIQREVDTLREYAQIMEDELYKKSEDDSMYHYDKLFGDGKTRLLYIDKLDDYAKFTVHFPYMLRHSLVTSIYSLLEERLLNTCNRSGMLLGKGNLNDYRNEVKSRKKHKGIFLGKEYLREYIDIDISNYSNEWDTLKAFNQLRNCIVHERGNTNAFSYTDKPEKRQDILDAIDCLGTNIVNLERGYIAFTNKACFQLLDTIEELFKEIYKHVVDMQKSAKSK
ncbi:hypothetical protein [Priestia megaterium]|uniref:hypothetical protein n=1 Tax=Priestia megaterium TaxID=1404 RepID=UPI0018CF0220|nr:hypothetical protein [Priestia megaterium]MBG9471987.1 hypothetical protein [Priestia megaterium]